MRYLVITKDNCPWCDRAKQHLADNGNEFVEVNVTNDEDIKASLRHVGWRTVPIIVPMDGATNYEGLVNEGAD